MKFPLLCGAIFLGVAPVAPGATLSYVSVLRQLTCGPLTLAPPGPFDSWDAGLAVPPVAPDAGSSASQQSSFSESSLRVVSDVTGQASRGASFCIIRFTLDEATTASLTGSMMFIGASGTTCISLINLAHHDQSIINEIILAPPAASESRPLRFSLALEPGTYELEAMAYGGGDGDTVPAMGRLEMVFSIPEPSGLLTALGALALCSRRRAAFNRS